MVGVDVDVEVVGFAVVDAVVVCLAAAVPNVGKVLRCIGAVAALPDVPSEKKKLIPKKN